MRLQRFLVCVHDVSPSFERETRQIIDDLSEIIGDRFALGVVPDWHGRWPLDEHPAFCRHVRQSSAELLLHGLHHDRARGWGLTSVLAERSDEMNGLDVAGMRRAVSQGQQMFENAFGGKARGFLAPAWQRGATNLHALEEFGIDYMLGFFAIDSRDSGSLPLATYTWDCGRWAWLGHVGHAVGSVLQSLDGRIPSLAIHPRDIARGYWPGVLRLIEALLHSGYEAALPSQLLARHNAEAVV